MYVVESTHKYFSLDNQQPGGKVIITVKLAVHGMRCNDTESKKIFVF